MNATQRLARFAIELKYKQIPAAVIERSKACILDILAVSLYGSTKPWSRMVSGFVRDSGLRGHATVMGENFSAQPAQATLANGVMAHAFELDNVRQPGAGRASRRDGLSPRLRDGGRNQSRWQSVAHGFCRRVRSDVAHRRRGGKFFREKRFSRARADRYFWRGGGGRQALAIQRAEDGQRPRHRGVVLRRSDRIFPLPGRRDDQAAPSRQSRGRRSDRGAAGEPRLRRPGKHPRREVRLLPNVFRFTSAFLSYPSSRSASSRP